jgi:SPOR domain
VPVATKRRRSRFHSARFVNILSTGTVLGKGFMATPINAPMAGEIWHLSIEDLFQPVQEAPRLGGEGPFVINLSVSTAPISIPTKAFAGCSDAHVYQIQVTEDGRTRYRLRLGPFASEDEADAVLAVVRDTYPGALTATASASDSRVIGSMQAKAEARQSSAQKPTDTAMTGKSAPKKVAADNRAPQKPAKDKTDAEISIDVAWPTPELVVPPTRPVRAAPAVTPDAAPKAAIPPAAAAPLELAPEWALPELDIPLPNSREASWAAKAAPVLTEVVAPSIKVPAPKVAAPTPAAAPVLTDAVAPKAKAPVVTAPAAPRAAPPIAAIPAPAAAQVSTPKPAATPKAPALKIVAPVAATPIAPASVAVTPVALKIAPTASEPPAKQAAAKQTPAPDKPSPPKVSAPLPKVAKPMAAAKPAPVLTQSVLSLSKAAAAKLRQSVMKPSASRLTSLQHVVVATAPAVREVKKLDEPLESLESTQTMRALTPTELEDTEASRWFVIELALADQAFDPDAVPNLDLFSEYRLYSVAGLDQGRVVHALRLGFFREEIGAVAVASYLAAYWDKPTIKRVSLAERERFADQRVEARKDVGATGKHAVIEITDELVARRKRSSKSLVSAKTSNPTIGR